MLCIIGCLATSLASIHYCDKEKCLWIFVCPRGQPPSPTEKQTYTINIIQFEIEEVIVFFNSQRASKFCGLKDKN